MRTPSRLPSRQLTVALHRLDNLPSPFRHARLECADDIRALYCLVPWLWKREELYSKALVEWHFRLSVLGILLDISSMRVSGMILGSADHGL